MPGVGALLGMACVPTRKLDCCWPGLLRVGGRRATGLVKRARCLDDCPARLVSIVKTDWHRAKLAVFGI